MSNSGRSDEAGPKLWASSATVGCLLLVCVVAVMIRLNELFVRCLWFDEAMSWRTSGLSFAEMMVSISRNTHAPLFFVFLHGWMRLFGDSLVALRSMNLVFVVAAVPLVWLLVSEMSVGSKGQCRAAGGFAALLFVMDFYQVGIASEVRMYPMMAMLMVLSMCLAFRVMREPQGLGRWFWFAASLVGMMYTHYFAFFVVAAYFAYLIGWVWWRCPAAKRRCVWRGLAGSILVSVSAFLPWLPVFLRQRASVASGWWTAPLQTSDLTSLMSELVSPASLLGGSPEMIGWVAALTFLLVPSLLMAIGVRGMVESGETNALTTTVAYAKSADSDECMSGRDVEACGAYWLLAWMIVVPAVLAVGVSYVGTNMVIARYFVCVETLWMVGVAVCVGLISVPVIRYGAFALLLLAFVLTLYQRRSDDRSLPRGGVRAAMAIVETHSGAEDDWVVDSPMLYFPAHFHTHHRDRLRLLTDEAGISFYTGLPVVRDHEMVKWYDLEDANRQQLWLVSRDGRSGRDLAANWLSKERFTVEGSVPFQESIWVTRYVRRSDEQVGK